MNIMSRLFNVVFFSAFFLSSLVAFATPVTNLPDELMYQGKPIDPLCLFEIEDTKAVVDLSKCGLNSTKGKKISNEKNQLISKGFLGYDYQLSIDGIKSMSGYSYYKAFGKVGRSVIVQTINNTGGTGSFSFLNLVRRDGNVIKISVLDGGDRCNGSLVDLKRTRQGASEQLVYKVQLTPYDLLLLAKDNPHHLKAYNDLSACAVCCIGTAIYQRNIGSDFKHEKLLYVDVSLYLKNVGQTPSTQKYQACFDKLLKKFGQKNHGRLDALQLSSFAHQFNVQCVHAFPSKATS